MSSSTSLPAQNGQASPFNRPARRRPLVLAVIALLAGPLALLLLRLFPSLDLRYQSPPGHFLIVTVASLLAVSLALLMLRAALLRRDGRVLLIGGAFLALSAIFFIHAVSTPGVVFHSTGHATQWSTPIGLLVCAILLALSAVEPFARQGWLIDRWRLWLAGGIILWLFYSGMMLFYVPHVSLQPAPSQSSRYDAESAVGDAYGDYFSDDEGYGASQKPNESMPISAVSTESLQSRLIAIAPAVFPFLTATSVGLFLLAALLYGSRWRRTPTRPLAALTVGAILLAETSIAAQFGVLWQLSFWLYHLLLFAAVVVVSYGVLVGYEQSGSLSSAVEGLLLGSTLQRQREGFQRGMAALLGALERGAVEDIPVLREQLRQRFALTEDQLNLLDHAVELVAQEREEQRRLRALAEVSRVASLELDADLLLRNAVTTLAKMTDASLCAVGLVDGDQLVFASQYCLLRGRPVEEPVTLPLATLPETWLHSGDPSSGPLPDTLSSLGCEQNSALLLPMRHHDQALGMLVVQPGAGAVDERMTLVYSSIAAHLAAALSNARLYEELREKHENILRAERAKEQLTQMIVHDLKSPLTAIMGYLDLLKAGGLKPEQQEIVEGGRRSSTAMLQLVDDILDIARLEEGRLELRREAKDIAVLLQECVAELGHWAREERKQVSIEIDEQLPPLMIDSRLMRRVIINLFSNAIKHTPPGTQIVLGASSDTSSARIWVRDSGPGIPAERQSRLFERFSTGGSSAGRQSSTGLGLTFCKLAVEAHGGSIVVESAVGQGTTFTIVLPLVTTGQSTTA